MKTPRAIRSLAAMIGRCSKRVAFFVYLDCLGIPRRANDRVPRAGVHEETCTRSNPEKVRRSPVCRGTVENDYHYADGNQLPDTLSLNFYELPRTKMQH